MSNIIFINENENIYEVLAEKDINIYKIKNKIRIIAAKANNNRIGYFQFKVNNEFVKICILPKIIKKDDKEIEENYLKYINEYFQIIDKYKNQQEIIDKVTDNYLDIILSKKHSEIKSFNSLLTYKYIVALGEIEKFFKEYKRKIYRQKHYISNELRFKIDIKKNITEINKAKIHQNGRDEISYSKIADITLSIIQYFLRHKINSLEDSDAVNKKSIQVSRLISKKFRVNKFKFSLNKILSYKIRGLFNNKTLVVIYRNLLLLLDLEGYFEKNSDSQILNKISNMICITFDPALIFEYYVFDKHMQDNINDILFIKLHYNLINKKSILYFKTKYEPNNYLDESNISLEARDYWSEPDLIIGDCVKDCKWKILKSLDDILETDFLKLKRDCLIRDYNRGVLVYPLIQCDYKNFVLEVNDASFKDGLFTFKVEECKII